MIDAGKAIQMFAEQYTKRYGNKKIELEDEVIIILNNCIMLIRKNEENEISINFHPKENLYIIDEDLDVYEEAKVGK